MPKELGLFYVVLIAVPLYIQWDQLIIVQVTLTKSSNWVTSNVMSSFQNVASEPLEYSGFVDSQDHSWRSTYHN